MTSLIFGSIWLGHKGFVKYKRDKQRQKNYERWEGLRDEYDEQRKINRESRSLDIQRTGASYVTEADVDRPILTLRDQQEANDARLGWRPQEAWDGPISPDGRRTSVEVIAGSGLRSVTRHKTGSTWDEDLPQPLRVHRRNWEEQQNSSRSGDVSRSGSVRNNHPSGVPSRSNTASVSQTASPRPDSAVPSSAQHSRSISAPSHFLEDSIEPIENAVPGGKMAELIELGDSQQSQRPTPFSSPPLQPYTSPPLQPYTSPPLQPFASPPMQAYTGYESNNPFAPQATGQSFAPPPIQPMSQPLPQPLMQPVTTGFPPPVSQPLSPTFSPSIPRPISPTFAPALSQPTGMVSQTNSQPFGQPVAAQSSSGNMEEWWNRP